MAVELFEEVKQSSQLSSNIELNYGPYGRGIFTNGTVPKGEVLLQVTPEQLITPLNAIDVTPIQMTHTLNNICLAIMGHNFKR